MRVWGGGSDFPGKRRVIYYQLGETGYVTGTFSKDLQTKKATSLPVLQPFFFRPPLGDKKYALPSPFHSTRTHTPLQHFTHIHHIVNDLSQTRGCIRNFKDKNFSFSF